MPNYQRFRMRNKLYDSQVDGIKKWPDMDKKWNDMRRLEILTWLYREGVTVNRSHCWTELDKELQICDFEIHDQHTKEFLELMDLTHRAWKIDNVEPPPNMLNLHSKPFGGRP